MSLFKVSSKEDCPQKEHTQKKFDTLNSYIKRKGVEVSLWKELLISSFLLEKGDISLLLLLSFAFEEYYSLFFPLFVRPSEERTTTNGREREKERAFSSFCVLSSCVLSFREECLKRNDDGVDIVVVSSGERGDGDDDATSGRTATRRKPTTTPKATKKPTTHNNAKKKLSSSLHRHQCRSRVAPGALPKRGASNPIRRAHPWVRVYPGGVGRDKARQIRGRVGRRRSRKRRGLNRGGGYDDARKHGVHDSTHERVSVRVAGR